LGDFSNFTSLGDLSNFRGLGDFSSLGALVPLSCFGAFGVRADNINFGTSGKLACSATLGATRGELTCFGRLGTGLDGLVGSKTLRTERADLMRSGALIFGRLSSSLALDTLAAGSILFFALHNYI